MIGKFSPHPIDVTARKARPSGEAGTRRIFGGTVMCGWDSRYKRRAWFAKAQLQRNRRNASRQCTASCRHLFPTHFNFFPLKKHDSCQAVAAKPVNGFFAQISHPKDALLPRVLVVDDDPMVAMAIEVCLQRQGMDVTIADGGEA